MKREDVYQRQQSASRLEAVLLVTGLVSIVAAVLAFLGYGILASLVFLILGIIAFSISKVLDLLGDLCGLLRKRESTVQSSNSEDRDSP